MRTVAALRVASLVALAACGASNRTPAARVDTLPGGIVRTIWQSPADSGQWKLVLDHVVQPAEGEAGELMAPADLALADDGTLAVADAKPDQVKIFGPDGRFLRTVGRDGEGPGEYRAAFIALRGDTLVVQDPQLSRASTFLVSTGAFLATRPSACCYYFTISTDGDGRAVVRAMSTPDSTRGPVQAFVRFGMNDTSADTILVPLRPEGAKAPRWQVGDGKVIRFSRTIPLQPEDVLAVDRTGGFVIAWSSEYALTVSRSGTDTASIFGRAWNAERVTDAEKSAIVDRIIAGDLENGTETPEATLRSTYKASDIPDSRPAFETVMTDAAGRRWVRLANADTLNARIDLFDRDGRWLDQLTLPIDKWTRNEYEPVALSKDRAAVIGVDEAGRPLVYVYRIERTE